MSGDLRTRVEALRDELSHKKAGTRLDVETMLAAISRVLDADPDTPTADAPADTDLHELQSVLERQFGNLLARDRNAHWWRAQADALLPLVRARVEAARQDTLNQAADAQAALGYEGTASWLRGFAERGRA